jgi:hypothetical protein
MTLPQGAVTWPITVLSRKCGILIVSAELPNFSSCGFDPLSAVHHLRVPQSGAGNVMTVRCPILSYEYVYAHVRTYAFPLTRKKELKWAAKKVFVA